MLAKMLRSVFLVRTAVQPRVSWKDVEQDEFNICIFFCFGCRNSGEIRIEKLKGEHNTADICTKTVSAPVLMKHLKTLKMEWRDGRHPSALNGAFSDLTA